MSHQPDTADLAAWEVVMPDGERRIMAVMSEENVADWREHDCIVNPLYRTPALAQAVLEKDAEIERLRDVVCAVAGVEPYPTDRPLDPANVILNGLIGMARTALKDKTNG